MGLVLKKRTSISDSGYFRIGSVILDIPPESISINRVTNNDELTTLRSGTPYYKKTGHQRLDVVVSWKAMRVKDSARPWKQWEDVRTVLAYLKVAPFVEVENAHIRQFVMNEEAFHSETDRMAFAIRSMKVETVPDLRDTLQVTLYLSWFNYRPYTLDFSYAGEDNTAVSAQDSGPFQAFVDSWMQPPNLPTNRTWQHMDDELFNISFRRYKCVEFPSDLTQNGGLTSAEATREIAAVRSDVKGTTVSKDRVGFLKNLAWMAVVAENSTPGSQVGMPAEFAVAQRIAEQGWKPAPNNNGFGIKDFKADPSGARNIYRHYGSEQESFVDHAAFILQNKRYRNAWQTYVNLPVERRNTIQAQEQLAEGVISAGYTEAGTAGQKLRNLYSLMRSKEVQAAVAEARQGYAAMKQSGKAPVVATSENITGGTPQKPAANAMVEEASSGFNNDRDNVAPSVRDAFAEAGWSYDHETETTMFFYQTEEIDLYSSHLRAEKYDSDNADTVPVQISVVYQNNVAQIPLSGHVFPTMQHIGSPGSLVSVTFQSLGQHRNDDEEPIYPDVIALNGMMTKLDSQYHDMRGKWRAASSIHRMQCATVTNKVLNMLGIDTVLPHQLHSETIPDSNNMLQVTMAMSHYKNRYEALNGYLIKDPSAQAMKVVGDIITGSSWESVSKDIRGKDLAHLQDFRDQTQKHGITVFTKAIENGWNPPEVKFNFDPRDASLTALRSAAMNIADAIYKPGFEEKQAVVGMNGAVAVTQSVAGRTDQATIDLSNRLRYGTYSYTDYIRVMAMPLPQNLKNAYAQAVTTQIHSAAKAALGPNALSVEGSDAGDPWFKLRTSVLQYNFSTNPQWTQEIQRLQSFPEFREQFWGLHDGVTPSHDPANDGHHCYADLGITDVSLNPDYYFRDYSTEMRDELVRNASPNAQVLEKSITSVSTAHGYSAAASAGNTDVVNTTTDSQMRENYRSVLLDKINPPSITMARAFPTYKVLLIEEDNDGPYYCFDDFYSYNSILNVEVSRHKDKPDIARIQLTNFSSLLNHKFYNNTTEAAIEKKDHEFDEIPRNFAKNDQTKGMAAVNENVERASMDAWEDPLTGVNHFGSDEFFPSWYYALRAGSKIQVRLGYDNDPDKLWPVFNGTVAEIEEGEIVTILCQGYMAELVGEVSPEAMDLQHGGDSKWEFYGEITGEPDSVLAKMVQGPFAKHFGSRKVFRGTADVLTTLEYHPLDQSIRTFVDGHTWATGAAIMTYLTSRKSRAAENVWINRFLTTKGENGKDANQSAKDQINNRMAVRPWYVMAPTPFAFSTGKFTVPKEESRLSPWRVMQCAARFWPEYQLLVKNYGFPFQADATLVFGDPNDYYYARPMLASEGGIGSYHARYDPEFRAWWNGGGKGQTEMILKTIEKSFTEDLTERQRNRKKPNGGTTLLEMKPNLVNQKDLAEARINQITSIKDFNDLMTDLYEARLAAMGMPTRDAGWLANIATTSIGWMRQGLINLFGFRHTWDQLTEAIFSLDKSLRHIFQRANHPERMWAPGDALMPVQKWHIVTTNHIIANTLALNENVNNAVRIDDGDTHTMKANVNIPDEETRIIDVTSQIIAPNKNVHRADNLWRLQAQAFLKEELGKMYRGELIVLGMPEVEPGDIVHVADTVKDIFGPIEVESVIHAFDEREGMISIIRPRAVVMINQATGAGMNYAVSQFFFGNSNWTDFSSWSWSKSGAAGNLQGLKAGWNEMSDDAQAGASVLTAGGLVTGAHLTAGAIRFGLTARDTMIGKRAAKWATGKLTNASFAMLDRAIVAEVGGQTVKKLAFAGASNVAGKAAGAFIPGVNIIMAAWTGYELIHGAISLALDNTMTNPMFVVPLTRYNRPWMSGCARWGLTNMAYSKTRRFDRMWHKEYTTTVEGFKQMSRDQLRLMNDRVNQMQGNQ